MQPFVIIVSAEVGGLSEIYLLKASIFLKSTEEYFAHPRWRGHLLLPPGSWQCRIRGKERLAEVCRCVNASGRKFVLPLMGFVEGAISG